MTVTLSSAPMRRNALGAKGESLAVSPAAAGASRREQPGRGTRNSDQVGQAAWVPYSTQSDCRGRVKVSSVSVRPMILLKK